MLFSKKCCLSIESQKRTSVPQTQLFIFLVTNILLVQLFNSCAELCEAFTFLVENRSYVQFEGMVYQQIVSIPMGTSCAPLIAYLLLYCYERDFMYHLLKSKRHDLIDKFNDTSRYIDDIFTIDNLEFEKHIPDKYQTEFQLNEAYASDKETSFLIM